MRNRETIDGFFHCLGVIFRCYNGSPPDDHRGMKTNTPAFGGWTNMYKYASHEAVVENLNEKSILLMGSSQFNRGQKYTYHPTNMFKGQDMSPMIIGTAYTQSLYHTIIVTAMDPHMKNRKVALTLSPQCFDPKGVNPEAYTIRFSDSNYLAMLENNKVSMGIKKKSGSGRKSFLKRIQLYKVVDSL